MEHILNQLTQEPIKEGWNLSREEQAYLVSLVNSNPLYARKFIGGQWVYVDTRINYAENSAELIQEDFDRVEEDYQEIREQLQDIGTPTPEEPVAEPSGIFALDEVFQLRNQLVAGIPLSITAQRTLVETCLQTFDLLAEAKDEKRDPYDAARELHGQNFMGKYYQLLAPLHDERHPNHKEQGTILYLQQMLPDGRLIVNWEDGPSTTLEYDWLWNIDMLEQEE